ncbi:Glycosylphosphatidylinositol (GPI) anchor assembly protein [Gnomoniopsis smithogilvyi]|uniref:Glycosylphosphatidylinositol (GPI) anchor assembly protein n=1 Tax=Gnomoniopsis smithogilvyi TaxID=1191159 RepID=A0A9W8Z1J6_9PEZI|nr:Glycosylphosphatidylinositol (GPI) anchor assembly protein [Gnomoniopsis smithogilvyi]
MSSSISKAPKAPSSASGKTTESPQFHPVPINPSAASQAARHVFPVLLGALFYAAFGRLVADPVPVMWASLPVVALLQVLYAFICLPMAGSGGTGKTKKQRPGEKKKDGSGPNFIVTALLALLLSLILTPVLHATMILFGAPLLTHASHTFLCAAHLSILTSFPLFVTHGVDPNAWLNLASFKAPFDDCYGGLIGGFLGAWLGAVPIPLDWDREWQKWPVTILVGIYVGYVLGRVLGGTLLFGKRF